MTVKTALLRFFPLFALVLALNVFWAGRAQAEEELVVLDTFNEYGYFSGAPPKKPTVREEDTAAMTFFKQQMIAAGYYVPPVTEEQEVCTKTGKFQWQRTGRQRSITEIETCTTATVTVQHGYFTYPAIDVEAIKEEMIAKGVDVDEHLPDIIETAAESARIFIMQQFALATGIMYPNPDYVGNDDIKDETLTFNTDMEAYMQEVTDNSDYLDPTGTYDDPTITEEDRTALYSDEQAETTFTDYVDETAPSPYLFLDWKETLNLMEDNKDSFYNDFGIMMAGNDRRTCVPLYAPSDIVDIEGTQDIESLEAVPVETDIEVPSFSGDAFYYGGRKTFGSATHFLTVTSIAETDYNYGGLLAHKRRSVVPDFECTEGSHINDIKHQLQGAGDEVYYQGLTDFTDMDLEDYLAEDEIMDEFYEEEQAKMDEMKGEDNGASPEEQLTDMIDATGLGLLADQVDFPSVDNLDDTLSDAEKSLTGLFGDSSGGGSSGSSSGGGGSFDRLGGSAFADSISSSLSGGGAGTLSALTGALSSTDNASSSTTSGTGTSSSVGSGEYTGYSITDKTTARTVQEFNPDDFTTYYSNGTFKVKNFSTANVTSAAGTYLGGTAGAAETITSNTNYSMPAIDDGSAYWSNISKTVEKYYDPSDLVKTLY